MRRLALVLSLVLIGVLPSALPADAGVGPPIDNEEQRVSEHGFRFGAEQFQPDVSGDRLVWQDLRGDSVAPGGNSIWTKDLTTRDESPVTTLSTQFANPRISGDWIVWTDRSPDGTNDDIWARELPTGTPVRVTTNSANQWNPAIDGNVVAWEDYRNGNVDIFKKNLVTGRQRAVVVAAGNQTSPSVSGPAVAWRDGRGGTDEADVYVRAGRNPAIKIADAPGTAESFSPHQIAVSGSRLIWNEPRQVGNPKILKTCAAPCTPASISVVDSVPLLPVEAEIRDLDLSGSQAAWVKNNGSATHVYTKDLATSDPISVVDTTSGIDALPNARLDGDRFAWTQQGVPADHSPGSDIYWRDLATADPPRRANSVSLGPFGMHMSPAADGDAVVYRGPGETGPYLDVIGDQNLFQVWATDLTTPREHFAVSTVLGTDTSRPGIVGSRAVWSDLRNCTSATDCPPNIDVIAPSCDPVGCPSGDDTFERDPLDSGAEVQLSDPDNTGGPPDADGSSTAWRCRSSEADAFSDDICVHDGTSLQRIPLAAYLIDSDPQTDDLSTVGNQVRMSGDLVVWYEFFFDAFDPGDCCEPTNARLHALNADTLDDEIIGQGVDVVGEFPDFEIDGSTVLWAGRRAPSVSKIWRNDATGCGGNPSPCDHSASATVFETPIAGHLLASPSIQGDRAAWIDCSPFPEISTCDVYTRTLSESDSHLVTNESDALAESPYVDGDRIYWVDNRLGNPDVFMESISGAALPGPDTNPPDPPTGFTAVRSQFAVDLSWVNPPDDFFRVRILRKSGPVPPSSIDDTSAAVVFEGGGTSFTDTDVAPGSLEYSYAIFAFDLEPNYSAAATTTSS